MNRKIATVVVTVLVFAMVGTIAWNEYLAGSMGAWERGGAGELEQETSTPDHFLPTNTSTTLPSALAPTLPCTPSPALPGPPSPTLPSSPTPQPPSSPTPTVTIPLMQVVSQFGVNLRVAPGGEVIRGLADGTLVQPYPNSEEEADGIRWLHVVTLDGVEGWLAVNNLIHFFSTLTATP